MNNVKNIGFASVLGAGVTAFTFLIAAFAGWIDVSTPLNWWEIAATATSYACTYLCVKQSRMNYPIGIVSTALLSYVFYTAGLYGSMALNLYLIPTLIYGWFVWGTDAETRPVAHVKPLNLLQYLFWTIIAGLGAYNVVTYFGGTLALLDTSLMVGSIFAQFLLDRKKIETWVVWALVNVVSIYVYFNAGLYLLALQFIVFLANTLWGWYSWKPTMKEAI